MMKVEVELPDDIAASWGIEPKDAHRRLQLELALHLYASGCVSIGRAAEISGISRREFENAVNSSGIVRNYSIEDLDRDLEWTNSRT